MLTITIPAVELFDEETEEFFWTKEYTLQLEHSLISLSKWESKWHIPFMDDRIEKTMEQMIDYFRCMTINNVDPDCYMYLSADAIKQIEEYIADPHTATTVPDSDKSSGHKEIITSELIYYWMVALQIPFETQKWHLNRLITLIRVTNFKNSPPKKRSMAEIMRDNALLNAQRRAKTGSKG